MGEGGDSSFRLNRIELDIKETKEDVKAISDEQHEQKEKLILMGADLKTNLETNKAIKNATYSFVVINVLGLVWAFFKSIY